MFSHEKIWDAIDQLARHNDLTPSGLARKAGLDPTSFNKSKRNSADGRLRWPSTESIHKILEATGSTIEDFMSFLGGRRAAVLARQPYPPARMHTLLNGHFRTRLYS